MLVMSDYISKLAITSLESKLLGVLMADKIGLKDGRSSVKILWTLSEPYIIPGPEPEIPGLELVLQ